MGLKDPIPLIHVAGKLVLAVRRKPQLLFKWSLPQYHSDFFTIWWLVYDKMRHFWMTQTITQVSPDSVWEELHRA